MDKLEITLTLANLPKSPDAEVQLELLWQENARDLQINIIQDGTIENSVKIVAEPDGSVYLVRTYGEAVMLELVEPVTPGDLRSYQAIGE